MDQTRPAHERLVVLDGIRGLAALVVVLFHVSYNLFPMHGFLAVDAFFLLSGYVIAGAYEARLKAGQGLSWFFGARMARLYPLYLLGLVLGLAANLKGFGLWPALATFAGDVVFLHLPFVPSDASFPLNGALWSLPLELGVNIAYAAGGYRLSNRVLAIVTSIAGLVFAAMIFHWGGANMGSRYLWNDVLAGCARVMFSFPLGVLAYRWRRAGRLPETRLSLGALTAVLMGVFFVPTAGVPAIDALLALGVLPVSFLLILTKPPLAGRVAVCATRAGRLSYPLYVVHYPVLSYLYVRPYWTVAAISGIALPIALALALFAHLVVEPWGKRVIESWFGRAAEGKSVAEPRPRSAARRLSPRPRHV